MSDKAREITTAFVRLYQDGEIGVGDCVHGAVQHALAYNEQRIRELEGVIAEVLPRYVELFEAAGLGDPSSSVAVQMMEKALAKEVKA